MHNNIEVRRIDDSRGVYAKTPIKKGETILILKGILIDHPTRYSIQLDQNMHLEVPENTLTIYTEEYQWKFLNHSCTPNSFIDVENRRLVALKDISSDEEICFNYNATEYEMAAPFECLCNNQKVAVRGYKYLSPEERDTIALYAASFLFNEAR